LFHDTPTVQPAVALDEAAALAVAVAVAAALAVAVAAGVPVAPAVAAVDGFVVAAGVPHATATTIKVANSAALRLLIIKGSPPLIANTTLPPR
jgi:hypothetical protein